MSNQGIVWITFVGIVIIGLIIVVAVWRPQSEDGSQTIMNETSDVLYPALSNTPLTTLAPVRDIFTSSIPTPSASVSPGPTNTGTPSASPAADALTY